MASTVKSPPAQRGPVVLKVVRVTGAAFSGATMDQIMPASLFPHPLLVCSGCSVRPQRGDREMVVDGGGHFNPAGIDGVHTLTLLFSSLTAHHRAEANPHTHRNL